MISNSRLKDILSYNEITGIFIWRDEPDDIAGTDHSMGYLTITIDGETNFAHRLAWLYVYGKWPKEHIDHVNHDKADNRISNLRDVAHKENMKNCKISKNNTSKVTGVYWKKLRNKWASQIAVDYKVISLGTFNDFFEAVCSRKSAENKHGFHANHGLI